MSNHLQIAVITLAAIVLNASGAERDPDIRLRDYLNNPERILQWNKSIADGWRMQQGICKKRIEHHWALYGEQVKAATPSKAPFQPKERRKLLVLQMFFHDDTSGMQGSFLEALTLMAEQTGAFELKVISTLTEITRGELFEFDAVLVNGPNYSLLAESIDPDKTYTAKKHFRIRSALRYHFMFEPTDELRAHGDDMRQALLQYVREGGGLIALGGAPRSAWPAYREMFGGVKSGDYGVVIGEKEPKELQTDLLKVTAAEPGGALTQMLPKADAISVHSGIFVPDRDFYEQSRNMTLLSVLAEGSHEKFRRGIARKTRWKEAVPSSWIRRHGEGRVFVCAFECSGRFLMSAEIQEHLLAGIQHTLGDGEDSVE